MTTLPGSPDEKEVITVDTAYESTKHEKGLENKYELVNSPPGSTPGRYVAPSPPPPSHQPLPPPPMATENGGGAGEEAGNK